MNLLPHLAARLLGAPLLIHRPKLDVILSVLGSRVGLADLSAPTGFVQPDRSTALADMRTGCRANGGQKLKMIPSCPQGGSI